MSSVAGGTRSWLADLRQRVWRVAPADAGPVVLRHSRIYILPTRRGLALMTTLAIMLVTSMNYALSLGFAVTFVVAGLVASALLQTFRNIAGIAAAPLAAGEGFVGDRIEFTLSLANPESTRRGIMVSARDSVPVTIDVPAGATRQAVLIVPAHRRGHVALGRVTVSTDFPLGLWQAWAYVHFPLSGIAYPAPERGAPPLPPGRLGGDARRAGRAADAEFSGLREYQLGDPMNRVAWKAVARGAGWYTKDFEGAGGNGPLVLDWAELPHGLDTEARLSRLAAWVLAAEREARPFALKMPGTGLPSGHGAGHRRQALAALALFPGRGDS